MSKNTLKLDHIIKGIDLYTTETESANIRLHKIESILNEHSELATRFIESETAQERSIIIGTASYDKTSSIWSLDRFLPLEYFYDLPVYENQFTDDSVPIIRTVLSTSSIESSNLRLFPGKLLILSGHFEGSFEIANFFKFPLPHIAPNNETDSVCVVRGPIIVPGDGGVDLSLIKNISAVIEKNRFRNIIIMGPVIDKKVTSFKDATTHVGILGKTFLQLIGRIAYHSFVEKIYIFPAVGDRMNTLESYPLQPGILPKFFAEFVHMNGGPTITEKDKETKHYLSLCSKIEMCSSPSILELCDNKIMINTTNLTIETVMNLTKPQDRETCIYDEICRTRIPNPVYPYQASIPVSESANIRLPPFNYALFPTVMMSPEKGYYYINENAVALKKSSVFELKHDSDGFVIQEIKIN